MSKIEKNGNLVIVKGGKIKLVRKSKEGNFKLTSHLFNNKPTSPNS